VNKLKTTYTPGVSIHEALQFTSLRLLSVLLSAIFTSYLLNSGNWCIKHWLNLRDN